MKKIHLKYYGTLPLCNIHKRWESCGITSTHSYRIVTCERCKRIAKAKGFACAAEVAS